MEDFAWIERIPKFLRWILFLPAVFIVYTIMRFIGGWSMGYALGPEDDGIISYLSYTFFYNFICVSTSLFISCLIAPKGRKIISSIYLGIILILTGMAINNFIYSTFNIPVWKVVFESLCTLGGYVMATVFVFLNEKDMKNISENSVTISP